MRYQISTPKRLGSWGRTPAKAMYAQNLGWKGYLLHTSFQISSCDISTDESVDYSKDFNLSKDTSDSPTKNSPA